MSEQESRRGYLHRELGDRLSRLASSVLWYRRRHYFAQMGTVVLSTFITIIAGMKSSFWSADAGSNLVLILGSCVAVISAWGAFFSPRESWHLSAETYGRFRALQAKLEFLERGQNLGQNEDQLVEEAFAEYQQILDAYNKKWQDLRQKSK